MDEPRPKLPLKRVELSLTKFNEVAIPHHLDLLRQHRANIIKYEQAGDLKKVQSEQLNASRVSAQLRTLLRDLELLRAQVITSDLAAFDNLTQRARDHTLAAIVHYLALIQKGCLAIVAARKSKIFESVPVPMTDSSHRVPAPERQVSCSAISTDSVGLVEHQQNEEDDNNVQMQMLEKESTSLAEREAVLKGWNDLQNEVRQLRDVWEHVHQATVRQREQVEEAAGNIEETNVNVAETRNILANTERLKSAWYPMAGLLIGGVVGGPLGLLIGIKAAAAAAFAGSCIGYTGVTTLMNRRRNDTNDDTTEEDKDK